jgi:inner membrane protease subunit 1
MSLLLRYSAVSPFCRRAMRRGAPPSAEPRLLRAHTPPVQRASSSSHALPPPHEESFFSTLQLLSVRGALAASWVYLWTSYVVDITLCEGPSMDPTIQSSGEIILLDKWNIRRFGLQDGSCGAERAVAARLRQQEERLVRKKKKRDSVWHEPKLSVSDLEQHRPLSWSGAWAHMRSPLSVGDVVVIDHPSRKGTVCKRVVGLPGDEVILTTNRRGIQSNKQQLLVVPDGHLWLEGDNPANSSDSRDYGAVPAALVVGRVLARIWPLRGKAWMRRGAPPRKTFGTGASTILPAGYDGQQIIKHIETTNKD